MANFRPGIKLTGSSGSGNALRYGKLQANKFGRYIPNPHNSAYTLLGQVVQDLFTEDDAGKEYLGGTSFRAAFTSGISFPSGQLWTRVERSALGDGSDSTADWIAVPTTLPAGYTARLKRNLNPAVKVTTSSAVPLVSVGTPYFVDYLSSTSPIYSASQFIRDANGVAGPQTGTNDVGQIFTWGPVNRNTSVGFGFSSGVSTNSPVGTLPAEALMAKAFGFRNIRIWHRITEAIYAAVASDFFLQTSVNGNVQTTFKGDFTFDASLDATRGRYYKIYDLGPFLAPIGTMMDFTRAEVIGGSFSGGGGPLTLGTYPGVNQDFYFSPRLDIPLPWTATSGNLIAPGGTLT